MDAYTVALAATVLSAGSTAARFGRRRCFTVGLVLFTLMSGACGAATSMPMLDLFRAAQGVGAAIMFATSFALISDAYRTRPTAAARSPPTAPPSARRSPSAPSPAAG